MATAGCAGKGPKATTTLEEIVAKETSAQQETKAINERLFASVSSAPQVKDYVLGEGDLLQVSVFEADELKAETRVGARGSISLPLLGLVEVKGLSTREAEQKIEDLYRQKYLHNPHVGVFVKEQVAGKVTLLGALKKPGTYNYHSRQHLFDVLASAEGLSDTSGRTVQVRRAGDDPSHPTIFLIDLDDVIKGGRTELNIEIKSGDVIFVPLAGMIYVDGAVRKPGSYPIKDKMSIQEAIAAAGGFTTTAKESNIKLVRYTDAGNREVVQLGIQDIRKEVGHDIELKDRDVLFIETDKMEALLYGLRLNLGAGLFGIGYEPPPTQ